VGLTFYRKEEFCSFLDQKYGKHKIKRDDYSSLQEFWRAVVKGLPDQELDTCNRIIMHHTGGGLNETFVPAIKEEIEKRFEQLLLFGGNDAN
jgi:hypothetical protein